MSESFAKIFRSILLSSIWRQPDTTRLVWITMLALAERDGFVGASVGGLAAASNVTTEACAAAIEALSAPDPDSRTPDNEGRRIEKVDRGWMILNYQKFRDMRDTEVRRAYERNRKREQRRRMSGTVRNVPQCPALSAKADAELVVVEEAAESCPAESRNGPGQDAMADALLILGILASSGAKRRSLAAALVKGGITTQTVGQVMQACRATPGIKSPVAMATSILRGGPADIGAFLEAKPAAAAVEHPRGMPVPYNSAIEGQSCLCPMCVKARAGKKP